MSRLSLPLIAALLVTAAPAFAADAITEEAVRQFYADSAKAYQLPKDAFLKKMDTTVTDDYVSTSKTVIKVPGQKPVEQAETMTKQQSVAASNQAYEAMKTARIGNTVTSIEISADGKSAAVTDKTVISGMGMPGQPIKLNGEGTCNDQVVLSAAGELQIKTSDCAMSFDVIQPKQ